MNPPYPTEPINPENRDFRKVKDGMLTSAWMLAALSPLVLAGVSIAHYEKHQSVYKPAYSQAMTIADTNHDGVTSNEERLKVYKELGIQLFEGTPAPELELSQLEQYIAMHKR